MAVACQAQFEAREATIADIHQAIQARRITCVELVRQYLDRIEAYDKKGPAINAIVTVNPKALDEARVIDAEIARGGITKPLQCIPMVVKDNFETIGLPAPTEDRSTEIVTVRVKPAIGTSGHPGGYVRVKVMAN